MLITKLNHCCFRVEYKNQIILTDPGKFATGHDFGHVDILIYSHTHGDHWYEENFLEIIKKNPNIVVITNSEVQAVIQDVDEAKETPVIVIEDGQEREIEGILFSGHGTRHAEIYHEFGQVMNTGYCIDNIAFFPGDAFTVIDKPIEILFVDIVGPFMASRHAIDYVRQMGPRTVIPMHEEVASESGKDTFLRILASNIDPKVSRCVALESGGTYSHVGK